MTIPSPLVPSSSIFRQSARESLRIFSLVNSSPIMALQPPVPKRTITASFVLYTIETFPLLTFRKMSRDTTVVSVNMDARAAAVP